jgi:DNA modification methylase
MSLTISQVSTPLDAFRFVIGNPKRTKADAMSVFPYYAGFSQGFAHKLVASLPRADGLTIMDPWNGGGTTTNAAANIGAKSIGIDLNPVMALVAKSHFAGAAGEVLSALLSKVRFGGRKNASAYDIDRLPLEVWFTRTTALYFAAALDSILSWSGLSFPPRVQDLETLSAEQCLAVVGLFLLAKRYLDKFATSNPTWIKRSPSPQNRIDVNKDELTNQYASTLKPAIDAGLLIGPSTLPEIRCESSTRLHLGDSSVDFVLTSPPYCTRIDYAVATLPELSLLGPHIASRFNELRRQLMGTTAIWSGNALEPETEWGATCIALLEHIKSHASKASQSYYYKTYLQYFSGLYASVSEIGRVLKVNGSAVFVVQNSHYKDIGVDLAAILTEMCGTVSLIATRREDFSSERTMRHINTASRRYKAVTSPVESVLCFEKE